MVNTFGNIHEDALREGNAEPQEVNEVKLYGEHEISSSNKLTASISLTARQISDDCSTIISSRSSYSSWSDDERQLLQ